MALVFQSQAIEGLLWQRELKTLENLGIWDQRRVWLMGKKKRSKSGKTGGSNAVATEIRQVRSSSPDGVKVTEVSQPTFFTGRVFELLALATTSVLAFWFLTGRIVGVQVSVLADEYFYLLDSHFREESDAHFPNFLFQRLYGITKMCGVEFYSCARSLNAFFVIFGAVFIYLIARQIGRSRLLAALVSISAIVGSYGTYTAYYMPEAIFSGLMMVFFWALIRFGNSNNYLVWVGIGSSLGIATLAKPHGLFLVPAIVIFITLWTRSQKTNWVTVALLRNFCFLASAVVTKLAFGYLLVGEKGLGLFGAYGTLGSVTSGGLGAIASSVSADSNSNVFFTSWGQVLMVTMILGLALPLAVHGLILGFKKDSELFESNKFRVLMGISLLNMMGAIAVFAVIIQFDVWMHTRYYSYLIPLSLVAILEALRNKEVKVWNWAKYLVFIVFVALSTYNLITAAVPYSSNWVDAPDFLLHIQNPGFSSFFIAIMILSSILWLIRSQVGVALSLAVTIIAALFAGAHNTTFLKANFVLPTYPESISTVFREFLPQEEIDRAVIVGNIETVQRILFSSSTSGAQTLAPRVLPITPQDLVSNASWFVVVGDQEVEGFGEPYISGIEYQMYSLDSKNTLVPRRTEISNFSSSCPDSDKSWVCGTETEVSFARLVPAGAQVELILDIAPGITDAEFAFTLGDSTLSRILPAGVSSVSLGFTNSSAVQTLTVRLQDSSLEEVSKSQRTIRPIWSGFRALG